MNQNTFKDYYEVLEISRNASDEIIKKAYLTLSKKYHPDVHPNKAFADNKMKDLNEAREILSDKVKKERYDLIYEQYHFEKMESFYKNKYQENKSSSNEAEPNISKPKGSESSTSKTNKQNDTPKDVSIYFVVIFSIFIIAVVISVCNSRLTNPPDKSVSLNSNNYTSPGSIDKTKDTQHFNNIQPSSSTNVPTTISTDKKAYITIGSTKDYVQKLMGTPKNIDSYFKTWYYTEGRITFDDNWKVKEWYSYNDNLKVTLGESKLNAAKIKIGSSKSDVINAMGTPKNIDSYFKTWYYNEGRITFDDNWKVKEWYNYNGDLKVTS